MNVTKGILIMVNLGGEIAIANRELQLGLLGLVGILAFISGYFLSKMLPVNINVLDREKLSEVYQNFIHPSQALIGAVITLAIAELFFLLIPAKQAFSGIELALSLALTISACYLASRLFKQFFDLYLLDATLRSGRKTDSDILILGKFLFNLLIVIIASLIFAQTHQINIFGIFASLGIGGLAVAFAAQKTLEQILGGIVLYLDRPFVVDDYIGLPDGTFGRVESIGLRSTKIRSSGKGTLVIVPNSSLTTLTIENFTGAKKVMALISLNLHQKVPNEERALIRQVIRESTNDIFGIDSRNTDIVFKDKKHKSNPTTQLQITFFILGSNEVSMELRRQLLDIANENISDRLREYGIEFDIEEPTIYVDSPITI